MVTSFSQARYPHSPNANSIEDGLRYQDHIVRLAAAHGIIIQQFISALAQLEQGESFGGYEIKLDTLCTETGRLSIEIAEKTASDLPAFVPSGIYASTRPDFYIQGNYTVAWLFATKDLRIIHQAYVKKRGKGNYEWDELPTIRKFYLPLADASQLCIKKFVVRPDGQYQLFTNRRRV